ncbi:MAG: nucleoside-diphosphate-sugar epimerase [Flavobacteria bacterium RIFCSPLOWO2_12_FULL_35_11]|nr:MAG: nucleoside-diphosphate-sugar epimerase [Flavobacteria bacterium RIFCSPLOWO2_12_FULL_35_11]
MKNKVFITGMNGFVGQNLKSYLKNDFDVTGISRGEKPIGLTYEMFLKDNSFYDAIVHLAGKAHDLKKTSNDSEYFEVNYELTKKLYDQFLASGAQQFIYISSVKAVADSVDGILSEVEVPNPVTAYGKSKQMSEAYLMANLPATKKVYILRPCMIHGPGNKGNLNLLYSLVSKGFPWPLGAFENQRSFLSIENLCFVIKELLSQNNIPSGVYNVADDAPLSTNQLIQLIAISKNKQAKILAIPKGLINRMAKLGDKLHLPLNTERLQKLTERYVVSNAKIKQAIGKPFPVKAKDGLLRTFGSFRTER